MKTVQQVTPPPRPALVQISEPLWLDDETLSAVRPQVRALLEKSPGFRALPTEQQRDIARTMVRVAAYMSNPQGLTKEELGPRGGVLAKAQADSVEAAKGKASGKIGTFAGSDFEAGAGREGVQQYKELIGAVNFPAFVGGLIQNVFQAIVSASIQQMNAYAEMLKSVAQTVDQFARDNISVNNARDWIIDKYPGQLGLDESATDDEGAAAPRLTLTNEENTAVLGEISREMELAEPIIDLSDPDQETRLVQATTANGAQSAAAIGLYGDSWHQPYCGN